MIILLKLKREPIKKKKGGKDYSCAKVLIQFKKSS
jgi:hypothetical protein